MTDPNRPQATSGEPFPGYAGAPNEERLVRTPSRRGLIIGLVVGGMVLLLLIAAAVVIVITLTATNSPTAKAEAVLRALVDRDAEQAVNLLGVEPGPLVSNEFYATVPNTIESYRVLETSISGVRSVVTVELVQESATSTVDLPLVRTDNGWQLDVALPALGATVDGPSPGLVVRVNGSDVGLAASELETASLLPGDYEVVLSDPSGLTESEPLAARLEGLSDSANLTLNPGVGIELGLTPEGAAVAVTAVNDHIAACIAQNVFAPSGGCGWSIRQTDGETNSDIAWTLTTSPTIAIGAWNGTGWSVTTDASGTARMTCRFSDATGVGDCWADDVPVDAYGTVTDLTVEGATFISDYN